MNQLEQKIDSLLGAPPYKLPATEKTPRLLEVFKEELAYVCERHTGLANYIRQWPEDFQSASSIADLPYLPVSLLKTDPALSLVETHQIKRTLVSSATTGQVPSRVVLDSATAKRMSKGVVALLPDFIGPARRPYLVVDTAAVAGAQRELGARGAAIQGLQPFASQVTHCLRLDAGGDLALDRECILEFARKHRDTTVLVCGFTYVLWNHLVKPLQAGGCASNFRTYISCIAAAGNACRLRQWTSAPSMKASRRCSAVRPRG